MDELVNILKSMGETTRLRILFLLTEMELTVSELTQVLCQSQPRVSRHLKLLTEAGLIQRFREGAWVFYRLDDAPGRHQMLKHLFALVPVDDTARRRDFERLQAVKAERAAEATRYFEENADDWDRIRALHVPEREVEAALCAAVGKAPIGTLLDVGTGTGRMLEVFAPQVERAIGIDLSRDMLSIARNKLDISTLRHCQVRQGDMYELLVADESTDLILFHQVLHFADNPRAAIVESARALSSRGRILIVDFEAHDLEFLRSEFQHRRLGFSSREIEAWAEGAGLSSRKVTTLEGPEAGLKVAIWELVRETGQQRHVA
ncbi:MAG: metalloregulator ArsR/SmtB family transcription factor [Pseudomonadota bacterium]